jgi:hypothetical protein
MDQVIELTKLRLQPCKHRLHLRRIGEFTGQQQRAGPLADQLLYVLSDAFVLVRHRQAHGVRLQELRNGIGNRPAIGNAEY